MVPIREGATDEDPSVTDPEERLARYTQRDHVRFYGLDVADRLESAGFTVTILDDTMLPAETVEAQRLIYPTTRQVFLREKSPRSANGGGPGAPGTAAVRVSLRPPRGCCRW